MRRLARPLLYLGTIAIVAGMGRIHAQLIGHYYFHDTQRLPWSIAYAGVLCVAAYAVGLPDIRVGRSVLTPAVGAAVASAMAISVAQLIVGSLTLPRFVVFAAAFVVVPWFVACSMMANAGRSRLEQRDGVVAVVSDEEAQTLEADLRGAAERPASLVAAMTAADACGGAKSRPLVDAVVRTGAAVVVLDREAQASDSVIAQAATLHEHGVRIRTLSLFYDEWLGKLPLIELERMSLLFDIGELHRAQYGRVKRLFDLFLGAVGLILLVPVIVFVVIGDLVANRGSLFYRQPRVGKNNRPFNMVKFRTMRATSETPEWTTLNDPRVTPFGRVLRRTHLDELPQVLNILRGDLSIVGPRPEQPQYASQLRDKIPFYDLRHRVRPGLTGWAQVKYDYGATESDALEKLQYEFYYLRHQSLALDLRIVARTVRSVIGLGGR